MKSIYNLNFNDLKEYFLSIGEKSYKATQLYNFLYKKKVKSFDEISTFKKELISKLKEEFIFDNIYVRKHEKGEDVEKFLFVLKDMLLVEAVLMYHDYGLSICFSSQVGCNMGCKFCESGRLKKQRNLDASEMVLQILKVEEIVQKKISRVVIMGIGEPFDNFDNVLDFIRIINSDMGLAIGSRHITVSTCGIVPKIKEFALFPYQVNLAISLHAANDEKRTSIMPINRAFSLDKLKEALQFYYAKTNRRITIEYVMLDQVNDFKQDAIELAKWVKDLNCYVNLIPYNPTSNEYLKRSTDKRMRSFYQTLKEQKVTCTIRREFGSTISAACGQLSSMEQKNKE